MKVGVDGDVTATAVQVVADLVVAGDAGNVAHYAVSRVAVEDAPVGLTREALGNRTIPTPADIAGVQAGVTIASSGWEELSLAARGPSKDPAVVDA